VTIAEATVFPPDWSFHMAYWVPDGDPEPEVPFPKDWDVCGVPDYDPLAFRPEYKRHGETTLAWPMYRVSDPAAELAAVCQFLEGMAPEATAAWFSLQDRYMSMSCGDTEMDAAEVNTRGFFISPDLIRRIRQLRLRLQVSFHSQAATRIIVDY
jgi:hypothetical protein